MKKTFQNSILFLLVIIILGIGIGMIVNSEKREGFSLPVINEIYNPIARKVRNYANTKMESFSNTTRVFLKRFRLI
jgi:hypothetical protein